MRKKERLVLMGGGPRPPKAALRQFTEWSKAPGACILIVTWASEIPVEVSEAVVGEFKKYFRGDFEVSLTPAMDSNARQKFLSQLKGATGVYFSGGDQNQIMKALEGEGQSVRKALETSYQRGVVFAGTSAGTAIMTKTMIQGDGERKDVLLGPGLGLLKLKSNSSIVDQHFSQRNRQQRLLKALHRTGTPLGIGIDEDTALIVQEGQWADVVGDHTVRLFTSVQNGLCYTESIFQSGSTFQFPEALEVKRA